jgi:hypothetical protein
LSAERGVSGARTDGSSSEASQKLQRAGLRCKDGRDSAQNEN